MPPADERGNVWIVEDSPLEAEMIRRALAPWHDAEVFAEGAAMLERLASSPAPDVVMLDLVLPGISGLDACLSIRERFDAMALPVLVLTMQLRGAHMLEALQAGANDYLVKPFDPRELVARVTGLARTTRLYRAHAHRSKQLALAADVGLAITEGSLSDVAKKVVDRIREELGAAGCAIAVPSGVAPPPESPERFEVLVSVGDASAAQAACLPSDGSAGTRVVSSPGTKAVLVLPLTLQGRTIGNVAVTAPALPVDDALGILAPLGHLLAVAIARSGAEAERASLLERETRARADAESANRTKDEFLAVLSHELRTPLNAIVGWTNLARSGKLPPDRFDDALEKVERNALSQAQLIDDLLDISRIITGKMTLRRAEVNVAAAARAALASVELAASRKGVELDIRLSEDARILGDDARIQQIVWNLLSNAIRFTSRGGRVGLDVEVTGDVVQLIVRDSGQGIEPEFLPHVFERFTQASTSKARSHGGLGLGLAIVRNLVELHGGSVEAKSEGRGKGATFIVDLPMQRAPVSIGAGTDQPKITARHQLKNTRILVVDDEPDARDLLSVLFEMHGATVATADNAESAMRLIAEQRFDALISDIGMPDEDGISLIRRARAALGRGRSLPAIALTAYASEHDRAQAMEAGFDAHVTKPLDADKLLAVLTEVLKRK